MKRTKGLPKEWSWGIIKTKVQGLTIGHYQVKTRGDERGYDVVEASSGDRVARVSDSELATFLAAYLTKHYVKPTGKNKERYDRFDKFFELEAEKLGYKEKTED